MSRVLTFASVCSGVEAASLAWEPLGFKPVFFSEIEPFPSAVLAARWPDTPNLGDMTKIKFNHEKGIISNGRKDVAIPDGGIDLLVGGTPCQSFSVAGKREGLRGLSGLCLDYVRLAYEGRFQTFLWENVPGVFSSDKGRDFATFLSYMVGYEVGVPEGGWKTAGVVRNRRPDRFGLAWRTLDAQYVRVFDSSHGGVDGGRPGDKWRNEFKYAIPQRRRRVFVVGCLGDWTRAARILFEREGDVGDCPPRREQVEEVARSFGVGVEGADGVDAGAGACRTDTFENHAQDSRVKPTGGVCPTISITAANDPSTSGNNPIVAVVPCVIPPIDANYWKGQGSRAGEERPLVAICTPFVKTAHPRNPDKEQGANVVVCAYGFKAGQSKDGGIGFEKENSPTVNAKMSALEPTVCIGFLKGNSAKTRSCGETEQLSPTLAQGLGSGGNSVSVAIAPKAWGFVAEASESMACVPINSMIIGKELKGGDRQTVGIGEEGDALPTIQAAHHHAVAYGVIAEASESMACERELSHTVAVNLHCGVVGAYGITAECANMFPVPIYEQVSQTLAVKHKAAVILAPCIVRRLLPVETERLMGFPDGHTAPRFTPERIEELIPDFIERFAEWDIINGKDPTKVKRKTAAQVHKWLSAMGTPDQPDAPRYKACGNSMCVNVMRWIGVRIAKEAAPCS